MQTTSATVALRRWSRGLRAVVCAALTWGSIALAENAGSRPLTPDDLFRLESVVGTALSPDGTKLAFVRAAPTNTAPVPTGTAFVTAHNRWFNKSDGGMGDIYLAKTVGDDPALNLTHGDATGTSSFSPVWSPDSSSLAFLSARYDGERIQVNVWNPRTGHTSLIEERGLAWSFYGEPIVWLDNQRLLFVVTPDAWTRRQYLLGPQPAEPDTQVPTWDRTPVATNTLNSGMPVDLSKRPQSELVIADVDGGTSKVVAQGHSIQNVQVSPDHRHFAFLRLIHVLEPAPEHPLRSAIFPFEAEDRYELLIADTEGRLINIEHNPAAFIAPNSLRWSADGQEFAFLGAKPHEDVYRVFHGNVDGRIEPVRFDGKMEYGTPFVPIGHGKVMIMAAPVMPAANGQRRADWWLVGQDESAQILSAGLKTVPRNLTVLGSRMIGVADGDIWAFDPGDLRWSVLTESFAPKITGLVGSPPASRNRTSSQVLVSTSSGENTEFFRLNLQTGATSPLPKPSSHASLLAYSIDGDVAVFGIDQHAGSSLTLMKHDESRTLWEANDFLQSIAEAGMRKITYHSTDGQELTGWVMLPSGYEPSRRYPCVVWAYPGWVYGDDFDDKFTHINSAGGVSLNLQLFTARGYAVLIASSPQPPQRVGNADPYLELTKGILPAVDKLVELGIADPQRLAFRGHSFGGYAALGLASQTSRFRAIVASAGMADLISYYGTFYRGPWESDYVLEGPGGMYNPVLCESGQAHMSVPPWVDMQRYVRNSPLAYAERVQTPVLLIHGSEDALSITQSEEFFTALYRQGKRGRFVRYWGENHVLLGPPSVRDQWMQIYSWLDEFLDLLRDEKGNIVFEKDRPKSRGAAIPLSPSDFYRLDKITRGESP